MRKKTVSAVFDSPEAANRAIDRLISSGIERDAISMLMSRDTRLSHYPEDTRGEGIAWGAGVGVIVGGLVAVAAVGPFALAVTGPLAAFFTGAALGGAGGTLLGALVDLGIPEERAQLYKERLASGAVFVGVDVPAHDAAEAERLLLQTEDPLPPRTVSVIDSRSAAAP